jgi:hypothetical protein
MSKHTHVTRQNLQAPPPPDPPSDKTTDSLAALGALYQGEKTDAAYIFNTAMAMMGIALAYLVGALPFVDKLRHVPSEPFAWLFLLLLPIPLWLVAAFQSLMTLNAMSHGVSVRIIENALFDASGLRVRVERKLVGSAAGDEIMDVTQANIVHAITSYVVYGGVFLFEVVFTGYALYSANVVVNQPGVVVAPSVWAATGIYFLLSLMVVLSWLVGFHKIGKSRAKIPEHPTVPTQARTDGVVLAKAKEYELTP